MMIFQLTELGCRVNVPTPVTREEFLMRSIFRAFTCLSLAIASAVHVQAVTIVDQSNLTDEYRGGSAVGFPTAQTFTVGVDGILASIDLQLVNSTGTDETLRFDLMSTIDGAPGASLFSTSIPSSSIPIVDFLEPIPFTSVDVSSLGLQVDSGDVLAFGVSGGALSPPWSIWATAPNSTPNYTDGKPFQFRFGWQESAFNDLTFRTFVETEPVPEPLPLASLVSLVIVGSSLFVRRGRRSSSSVGTI